MTRRNWVPVTAGALAAVVVAGGIAVAAVQPWSSSAPDAGAVSTPTSTTAPAAPVRRAAPHGLPRPLRRRRFASSTRPGRRHPSARDRPTVSSSPTPPATGSASVRSGRGPSGTCSPTTRCSRGVDDGGRRRRRAVRERRGPRRRTGAGARRVVVGRRPLHEGRQDDAAAGRVLDHETATTDLGRILLPGPWADTEPYRYDASYASPAAYRVLAKATGDDRWEELEAGSRAVTAAVLDKTDLPSDWSAGARGRHRRTDARHGAGHARPLRVRRDADAAPVRRGVQRTGPGPRGLDRADAPPEHAARRTARPRWGPP